MKNPSSLSERLRKVLNELEQIMKDAEVGADVKKFF